jgi:hypothetical protein
VASPIPEVAPANIAIKFEGSVDAIWVLELRTVEMETIVKMTPMR